VIEDTSSKVSRYARNLCNYRGNKICWRVFVCSVILGKCVANHDLAMAVFSDFTTGTILTQPLAGNGRLLRLWYPGVQALFTEPLPSNGCLAPTPLLRLLAVMSQYRYAQFKSIPITDIPDNDRFEVVPQVFTVCLTEPLIKCICFQTTTQQEHCLVKGPPRGRVKEKVEMQT
jgi:hypothetical protein